VLAANGLALASVAFCWPVIIAMGEPRKLAPLQILSLIVGGPSIWWASTEFGLVGAAWAMVGMSTLYAALVMRVALTLMRSDTLIVLRWLPRVLCATLAMAVCVRMVQAGLPPITGAASAAVVFIGTGVTGAASYPVALLGLWWMAGKPVGPESTVLSLVGQVVPRLARSQEKILRPGRRPHAGG